ncbi:MAG: transcription termination/antitermination protein NusA [Dehalococcoidia bacterium]|nr:transcription termination/antitermination protein NusA [Dehalococcoidia bacterium]MQG08946.1 transcription termination/antitermination protein NusA [SAR202 cluster bacterium]
MKSDLLLAVNQLAAERNLPKPVVLRAVEFALAAAYKRDPLSNGNDVIVTMDSITGETIVKTVQHVVEEVEDEGMHLTLDQAKEINPDYKIGDIIETGQLEFNPGRIASQTAKQVLMQKLRDSERDIVFEEYIDKEGEILTGTIQRVESRWVTVDIGNTEAIMPPSEQSSFERYRPSQQLKFYVVQVARTIRGPEIIVSRTHPDLLRKLFEVEVPEIYNGVIDIKAIAREPGARSKVAVVSNQEGIDAVGACVGLRGIRIQNVVNELLGEKIDVVEWDEDPVKFISNSLSPAVVDSVDIDKEEETALVIVPDKQLSLAIGKDGQNARLSSRLTNWKVDIQGVSVVEVDENKKTNEGEDSSVKISEIHESEKIEEEVHDKVINDQSDIKEKENKDKILAEEAQQSAQDELIALEKELEELEKQEKLEKDSKENEMLDVSSDELWQVDDSVFNTSKKEENTGIRFAEDISGFYETDEGRKGGKRGGSSAKSKRRK